MPFRGEEGAPIFDRTHPTSLRRYFVQLETLFARYRITDDLEKKSYTTSFLECDLADDWEALREFSDENKTYMDFTSRLFDLYNLNIPRYTILDLEQVVSDQFQRGFQNLQDLSEYHLRFNAISSHLLNYGLLSPSEQSRMYLQAFDTSLHSRIDFRLQIQYPDHLPSLLHPIDMIFEAARWILRDPSSFSTPPTLLTIPNTRQTPTILNVTLRDLMQVITDAITNPKPVQATHVTMHGDRPPAIPLLCPSISIAPSASFMTSCALTEDISTSPLASTIPYSVQARIDAIEKELQVLRAQPDPPIPTTIPRHSTTVTKQVPLSQIVNPATFVHRNRVYQAIYHLSRPHISHIPSISTANIQSSPTVTAIPSPISAKQATAIPTTSVTQSNSISSLLSPSNPLPDVAPTSSPPINPAQPSNHCYQATSPVHPISVLQITPEAPISTCSHPILVTSANAHEAPTAPNSTCEDPFSLSNHSIIFPLIPCPSAQLIYRSLLPYI